MIREKRLQVTMCLNKVRHIVVGGMEKVNIYIYENYVKNKRVAEDPLTATVFS